jgi:carbonic anhydrase
LDGNKMFVAGKCERGVARARPAWRSELLREQHPIATVLCCSDSRLSPNRIFACGLGDLFVIRNAGNLATEVATASIEYGCCHTGTPLLIVLGHESCGAVTAAVDHFRAGKPELEPGSCLGCILDAIEPSVAAAVDAHPTPAGFDAAAGKPVPIDAEEHDVLVDEAVRAHACRTCEDAVSHCKPLAAQQAAGKVRVVAAYYSLATGEVSLLPSIE